MVSSLLHLCYPLILPVELQQGKFDLPWNQVLLTHSIPLRYTHIPVPNLSTFSTPPQRATRFSDQFLVFTYYSLYSDM